MTEVAPPRGEPTYAATGGGSKLGSFLTARRKAVAALLSFLGVLTATDLGLPPHTRLIIQSIIAVLGVYGVHEIPNYPGSTL